MQNKEIIITREQALALHDALRDCLDIVGAYRIKINVTDDSIQLTAHVQTVQVKL